MSLKNILCFSTTSSHLAHFGSHNGVLSVHNLAPGSPTAPVYVKTTGVLSIDFLPGGSKLATATTHVTDGSGFILYSFPSDSNILSQEPYRLKLNDELVYPQLIKYSGDGSMVAVFARVKASPVDKVEIPTKPGQVSWKNILLILDTTNYEITHKIDITSPINAIEWNKRGDCVLTGTNNGRLNIYQVAKDSDDISMIDSIFLSTSSLSCLKYSDDDDFLIAGTRDGNVLVLDAKTLTCIKTLLGDINTPVACVSIGKLAGVKIAAITYTQGSNLPAYFVLLDKCDKENPIIETLKTQVTKKYKFFERAMNEHLKDTSLIDVGTIIGEFSAKLVDSAPSLKNTLNIIGDGVQFQPNEGKDLGMISFINVEGKVAIRSLVDVFGDYWRSKFHSQMDKWAFAEKKSSAKQPIAHPPRKQDTNNRQSNNNNNNNQSKQNQLQNLHHRQPQHQHRYNNNNRGEKRNAGDYDYDNRNKRQHRR